MDFSNHTIFDKDAVFKPLLVHFGGDQSREFFAPNLIKSVLDGRYFHRDGTFLIIS